MLMLDPKARITIPEILSHPWMVASDDMGMFGGNDMDDISNFNNKDFMMGLTPNNNNEPDIN